MLEDVLVEDYPVLFKNTVIMVDNIPVYIADVHGGAASVVNMVTGVSTKRILDKNTHISLPNLGYANLYGGCIFINRIPARVWKYGLHRDNIEKSFNPTRISEKYEHLRVFYGNYISEADLHDMKFSNMYRNIYPTFQEALDIVANEAQECAFDRQFSVDTNNVIYYKGVIAGTVVDGKINLIKASYYDALPKELKNEIV